jgi:hypothetical protein
MMNVVAPGGAETLNEEKEMVNYTLVNVSL